MNKYILLALNEAKIAMGLGDYPVGAIIVDDDGTIIKGRNERNTKGNKKSHAEINLINNCRNNKISNKIIYVTLEPCEMCMRELIDFGIQEIHYILEDPINGGLKNTPGNINIIKHDDKNEYLQLLLDFFPKDVYLEHREYYNNLLTK